MLNPELIKIYGNGCESLLTELLLELGDGIGAECYMSTIGYTTVGAAMMPTTMVTLYDMREVNRRIEQYKMIYPIMLIKQVSKVPSGYIPLYVEDYKRRKNNMKVNPTLLQLYGEESRESLQNLVDKIGEKVAPTVYVFGKTGCKYINGVKIPNALTTEASNVNYVKDCVKRFYEEWGGEALNENLIEVWDETDGKGDIPLCAEEPRLKNVDVNPELIKFCGEESRSLLEQMIYTIGEEMSSSVKVISEDGTQDVDGVKMPKTMSVVNSDMTKVSVRMNDFTLHLGRSDEFVSISTVSQDWKEGDIPISVPRVATGKSSGFFNAAALMGGD